jgi:hypothetical protein
MDEGGAVPARCPDFDRVWPMIAAEQDGVVARRQLLAAGLTPGVLRRELVARRWRRLYPGVYATFNGTVPDRTQIWAAVLRAGNDAVAAHRTALWLAGALDERPSVIEVAIPHERRAGAGGTAGGLRLHRMRHLSELSHPAARPPRLRLEAAVLAATQTATSAELVLDLVLRCTQRRLTTAFRLEQSLARWPRHRWRTLLQQVLGEVHEGVASALELRYARDVERAHGLPHGSRNRPEHSPTDERVRYRDVRYETFGTVVELDGREAHPVDQAFRDLRRDNAVAAAGGQVLRYGWRDVAGRACLTAAQVGAVLANRGWTGRPRPCGPTCRAPL